MEGRREVERGTDKIATISLLTRAFSRTQLYWLLLKPFRFCKIPACRMQPACLATAAELLCVAAERSLPGSSHCRWWSRDEHCSSSPPALFVQTDPIREDKFNSGQVKAACFNGLSRYTKKHIWWFFLKKPLRYKKRVVTCEGYKAPNNFICFSGSCKYWLLKHSQKLLQNEGWESKHLKTKKIPKLRFLLWHSVVFAAHL